MRHREQYPIIIHPYPLAPRELRDRWNFWGGKANSRTINWFPGNPALDDVSYLDDDYRYPDGAELVVCGQMADACVKRKLVAIAGHPRVQSGQLHVVVDRAGTMEREMGELDRVVTRINRERRVQFEIA